MPRTDRRPTHVRSRFSRCLFTTVIAVLLLLSLHGSSIAGTYPHHLSKDTPNTTTDPATRDAPLPPPQSSPPPSTFAAPQRGSPIVSLQGACRSELKLYCHDEPTSPLRCLVGQFYRLKSASTGSRNAEESRRPSVFSDVCEAWLTARDVCLSFVHAHGRDLCGAAVQDARECLRQIPAVFLPPKCVTSDYYEGVRLVGKLRQHQTADARLRRIHGQ
ncbi:hypothetical protein ABB37_04977 [Leptomonas pyrrhocoris]|uniref:Enriched in surface-labeled proteome protein 18 n=1 Tax=Leptomonas pyrrhocoris TaxID=157538 RepID=A0A0N0DV69_LEPPY|nr:hypothetical protein ABB37_04977 [Leptomonas pyrrhocoris]KPA79922.1 hypothetical protein ABB37_04977 [Leptomonas pyrrhocoris]|eukprot:XP_015658361.1 hypothetical protein ABB37_04977 [Leptomonas pyrrhocoris]